MKKLILTAHDFGLSQSVNQGIEYVIKHSNNPITELSILPNAPNSDHAVEIAKKYDISCSLCLNFTSFKPLSDNVQSLVDEGGEFLSVDVPNWDFSSINKFDPEDIQKELDAQWNWFIDNFDKKPSAILSRKNETGDPKILIPMVDKAKKEKVAVRTPVWKWKENYGAQSYVLQEGVKSTSHVYVYPAWELWGVDMVTDFNGFVQDANSKEGVAEVVVLMGFVDEDLFKTSTLNWEWGRFIQEIEYTDFTNKLKNNFQMISYKDL